MKQTTNFQINLNLDYIESLDDTLNSQEHISQMALFVSSEFKNKPYHGISAWDCICVCVRRIRDTTEYLNSLVLGKTEYGSAFDFINFINNASVILSAIDMLAKIFDVDLKNENSSTRIFNQAGKNGKGTDKKYFEFLRSLCAVHPMETSRYRNEYQSDDLVTCPNIIWTNDSTIKEIQTCDLFAHAFNNDNSWGGDVCIYIKQIFSYIEFRYGILREIEKHLKQFHERKIIEFRNKLIESQRENESELDYIDRLNQIEIERYGSYNDSIYEFAKEVVTFKPSNRINEEAASRYIQAWRFALDCQLNVLRDMTREGVKYGGIENDDSGWTLFEHLKYPGTSCNEFSDYTYQLEKIGYLDGKGSSSDAEWGRVKLKEVETIFRPYILMDIENDSDKELYMLSRIGLYEIAIKNDCNINKIIPNDMRYRKELLK